MSRSPMNQLGSISALGMAVAASAFGAIYKRCSFVHVSIQYTRGDSVDFS